MGTSMRELVGICAPRSANPREARRRRKAAAGPGWKLPSVLVVLSAGGWRSAWARGITREGYPKGFDRAERKAANKFLRKVLKDLSECTNCSWHYIGCFMYLVRPWRKSRRRKAGRDTAWAQGGRPRRANVRRAGPFDRKNSVLPESLGPYGTSVLSRAE